MNPNLLPLAAAMITSAGCHATAADRPPPDPPVRVVLVHGFLETGDTFKMIRQRLETRGAECLVPRLRPNDGRGGLERLAGKLKSDIDSHFGPDAPVSIIGFSMGGIVSRHYLQELGGARRCKTFITISSPHQGTRTAWLYPTRGAEQMRPGSGFLTRLRNSESRLSGIQLVSYRTPLDLIILPADSSVWEPAENREFMVAMHPLMLSSKRVIDDIEARLLP